MESIRLPHRNMTYREGRTAVQLNEFRYTWIVENVSYDINSRRQGVYINSPTITVYNNRDKYELQLKLYPNGNDNLVQGSMCVELEQISCPAEPKEVMVIELYLRSNENQEISFASQKRTVICSDNKPILSFNLMWRHLMHQFISMEGSLRISCLIIFDNGNRHIMPHSESVSESCRKEQLIDDLTGLLTSPKFSDVKLLVAGKEFCVHKVILAARSPVFSAMLESNMMESKVDVIRIGDIEHEIMTELLRFIYTGKVENLVDLPVVHLLAAADMYQIDQLRIMCEAFLADHLSLEKIPLLLQVVDQHVTCTKLRDAIMKFLASNSKEVAALENFDQIMRSISSSLVIDVAKTMMLEI